ncbi:hypothetical protein D0962_27405 [Leptolyngbyaceae cyanobacterium CCMR0082]|uniref:Uncharacterized protein n=1 Tax=Adonisia turfae CCMR0082 TaxID=2304604 RepID=A0A6M0SEI4_9CYAN|nr:hypothetical protein [Adonisia turfae]NEZ66443.1 hypothetical protein [Adonisia turfae CCMR0082]
MVFQFENLDSKTRQFMLQEVDLDIANGNLYMSKRFNSVGSAAYPELLREAVREQNEVWLTAQLQQRGCMKSQEERQTKKGISYVKVPVTAAETLSDGEFNRFYIRGVCARAVAEGKTEVEIYRAKAVSQPRAESQMLVGQHKSAVGLLDDLRNSPGTDTVLGLPPGPNSGLSVRLI